MPSNAARVLDAVRRAKGAAAKKSVAADTGLSWGTMCNVVNDLIRRGVIAAGAGKTDGPGRPRVPLAVRPDAGFWCGVDIGSDTVRLLFCDLDFRPVHREKHPAQAFAGAEFFYERLARLFARALSQSTSPVEKLLGVGMAVSGVVDAERGEIVSGGNWGFRRGMGGLEVAELSARFGRPACAFTTQAAAAAAEYHFGGRAGCGDLVTIGLGVGIGSGVVANHQLLVSHPKRPVGYIGHTLIPNNPRICSCGFRGCLEAYSGGHNLEAVARERLPERPQLHCAAALDRAAAEGDAPAASILDTAASYNAVGVATMIQLYSPEALVFSGGQSRADGYLYQNTLRELRRILPAERRDCSFEISSLGEYQSALGAARLAFERFF